MICINIRIKMGILLCIFSPSMSKHVLCNRYSSDLIKMCSCCMPEKMWVQLFINPKLIGRLSE